MTPDDTDDVVFERMLLQSIFSEIKTVRSDIRIIRSEQVQQGKDIAGLKVKSGLWGGLSGAFSGGFTAGMYALISWMRGSSNG